MTLGTSCTVDTHVKWLFSWYFPIKNVLLIIFATYEITLFFWFVHFNIKGRPNKFPQVSF